MPKKDNLLKFIKTHGIPMLIVLVLTILVSISQNYNFFAVLLVLFAAYFTINFIVERIANPRDKSEKEVYDKDDARNDYISDINSDSNQVNADENNENGETIEPSEVEETYIGDDFSSYSANNEETQEPITDENTSYETSDATEEADSAKVEIEESTQVEVATQESEDAPIFDESIFEEDDSDMIIAPDRVHADDSKIDALFSPVVEFVSDSDIEEQMGTEESTVDEATLEAEEPVKAEESLQEEFKIESDESFDWSLEEGQDTKIDVPDEIIEEAKANAIEEAENEETIIDELPLDENSESESEDGNAEEDENWTVPEVPFYEQKEENETQPELEEEVPDGEIESYVNENKVETETEETVETEEERLAREQAEAEAEQERLAKEKAEAEAEQARLEAEYEAGEDENAMRLEELRKVRIASGALTYVRPPLSLWKTSEIDFEGDSTFEVENKKTKIKKTLANFGISSMIGATIKGTIVSQFEIKVPSDTNMLRIQEIVPDIASDLGVAHVRLTLPTKGTNANADGTISAYLEVVNKYPGTVLLRDAMNSKDYARSGAKISIALGKTILGNVVTVEMDKLSTLLVADQTGDGIHQVISNMIASIMYKASPTEVNAILIDTVGSKLRTYRNWLHLGRPVLREKDDIISALDEVLDIARSRMEQFAEMGVRDLKAYNLYSTTSGEDLPVIPRILIVIADLKDLLGFDSDDIKSRLTNLVQFGRKAGIHIVAGTTATDDTILNMNVNSLFESRIMFQAPNVEASKRVLGTPDAYFLSGHGDVMYFAAGESGPSMVQLAQITDDELRASFDFIRKG